MAASLFCSSCGTGAADFALAVSFWVGGGGGGAPGADALQQHRRGLVVGVLRHQFAFKGTLQDALAQTLGGLGLASGKAFVMLCDVEKSRRESTH